MGRHLECCSNSNWLRTLSTYIRWYAHHQDTTTHLSHFIDLYESFKEGPLALLDEVFEFKEKYIYGCADLDENGEVAIFRKSDSDGQIFHLKDKAKTTGISLRDRNPLAKEFRSLRAAKTKIEAKLAHLQEQAK